MAKILLLEDDQSIRSLIRVNLLRQDFDVLEAENGEEALVIFNDNPDIDLAILDVMLPEMNGYEVCSYIRKKNSIIGIIMLTAKSQEIDKIKGLEHGADDYVTKPFSPNELLARVNALYRRIKVNEDKYIEEIIEDNGFRINVSTRECHKNGELIDLTPTEFSMLKYFATSNHEILTREQLLASVWGDNFFGDPKIVDVNIRRLRSKIENDPSSPIFIETVWGKGYRWGR